MKKSHYIMSYDISSNRLRLAVCKLLQRQGAERLQKSVFFAPNMLLEEIRELRADLQQLMLHHPEALPQDSLICFPIRKQSIEEMVWAGESEDLRRLLDELLFILL
ncbi:CRISPR-associated endonuclease Cas2 [Saprospira grandis]|nr:CRISPR-associated endonuclease Cas2 [Saprospira grandis]WBM74811.1 CRISPR-associated endonuclease Cas2 [Saprospira grandis]